MKVIGLTGPSGSGKGWVCNILSKYNIPSIDTDAVYRQILIPPSPCLDELCTEFGLSIIKNGSLDRSTLAEIVFSNGSKLAKLNTITHKYILSKTDEILESYKKSGIIATIVDAPALFEAKYDTKCDFVIAVLAPMQIRLERIMKRDSISQDAALKRLNAQKPDEFYSSRAKYTVTNHNQNDVLHNDLLYILRKEGLVDC